jgi:amino acid transporter
MNEKVRLKRTLTTKDLVIYGIVFMVPVAPFAWYGSYLGISGGMVALAYVIGMVAMLFTGFSYATMSANFPIAGSVYSYVKQGTNSTLGFLSGWAIMLDYIFLPAVAYLVGSLFIAELTPAIPFWVWILIFAITNTVINALGVKLMSRVSWILFALQAFVILYFLVGVIRLLALGEVHLNFAAFYNPDGFNMQGVLQATAIVILSYLGFDAISTLAEETKNAEKSVGRATIVSILLIGFLFIVITYFAGVVTPDYKSLNSDTAFLDILQKVGGSFLVTVTIISIVLSFGFAAALEGQAAVARIIFAMGRDGILPKFFGKVHPKYRTPFNATIFIGVLSVVVAIIAGLEFLAGLLSFGALLGFMTLNLTVIWHFYIKKADKGLKASLKYLVSPLIGFVVCLYIFLGLGSAAFIVGGIWMLLGFVYILVKTRGVNSLTPSVKFEEERELAL